MNKETYIRAVLECIFAGFKDELIEIATISIMGFNEITCKECAYGCKTMDEDIYFCAQHDAAHCDDFYCKDAERKESEE